MVEESLHWRRPRSWIALVAFIILLIFLYYYQPFETYLLARIPNIHFSNVLFWFASLVGVLGFVVSHWQSFKQHIFRTQGELNVEALVFETLQIAILVAVIFCAGAMLQAIEMLSELLMHTPAEPGTSIGARILAIIVLVILAILFFLLHHVVSAFRDGWRPRRRPRVGRPGN